MGVTHQAGEVEGDSRKREQLTPKPRGTQPQGESGEWEVGQSSWNSDSRTQGGGGGGGMGGSLKAISQTLGFSAKQRGALLFSATAS